MYSPLDSLKHVVGDKQFLMVLPKDAALGEIHDALVKMLHYVIQRINSHAEQQKPLVQEEPNQPNQVEEQNG